jgi:predicted nucleic acid-binding protein
MPGADPPRLPAVLDSSVGVRWLVPEVGSREATALLGEPLAWVAPRLLLVEVASALRRKARGGELRAEVASLALDALLTAVADGVILLVEDEEFVATALLLALQLGHKVPDCLYLALAERLGATLVTADQRLGELSRARGMIVRLIPSA